MKALELIGDVDEDHQLHAEVPEGLPAGPVRLIVLIPEKEDSMEWTRNVAAEWSEDLRRPASGYLHPGRRKPIDQAR